MEYIIFPRGERVFGRCLFRFFLLTNELVRLCRWLGEQHVHTGAAAEVHRKHIDNGGAPHTHNGLIEYLLYANARGREMNEIQ
jgi:hypothetical protein